MRVLYVTSHSTPDGVPRTRASAVPLVLRAAGIEIVAMSDVAEHASWLVGRVGQGLSKVSRRSVLFDRSRPLLAHMARQVAACQAACQADAVVTAETPLVALAQLEVPVLIWTDTVFGAMVGYYPEWSRLSRATIARGNRCEAQALRNAAATVFLSEWAARNAKALYDVPTQKLHVVPFGGVLTDPPSQSEVAEAIHARRATRAVSLLWIGRDWYRKGGDVAVAASEVLLSRGYEVRLILAGCRAPHNIAAKTWIENPGFVGAADARAAFSRKSLFLNAHVHLLPTRAECMGLSLPEASAHGTPSVATRTGGTSSAILHGQTGFLVPEQGGPEAFADAVARVVDDRATFTRMADKAYVDYYSRLSYAVTGTCIRRILEATLSQVCA